MNKFVLLSLILVTLLSTFCVLNNTASPRNPTERFLTAGEKQLSLTYDFKTVINTLQTTGDLSNTQENVINTASRAKFTPIYNKASNTYSVMIDYEDLSISKPDSFINQDDTGFFFFYFLKIFKNFSFKIIIKTNLCLIRLRLICLDELLDPLLGDPSC